MKPFNLLVIWLFTSSFLGIPASCIPWGDPNGFHGEGLPVFTVAFDRNKTTGEFIPYSSPLGYVINTAIIFLGGIAIGVTVKVIRKLLHFIASSLFSGFANSLLKNPPTKLVRSGSKSEHV